MTQIGDPREGILSRSYAFSIDRAPVARFRDFTLRLRKKKKKARAAPRNALRALRFRETAALMGE